MASSHSEEGSDLEELLSQLEEESLQQELVTADNDAGPLLQDLEKRYEKLRAQSFTSSHVNTELDASDNSKSCSLQTGDQGKGPASPPGQEACDAVCADEVHLVDKESSSGIGLTHASKVAQGDAAKKASSGIPPQGGLDSANASKVALVAGDAVKEASIDRPHLSPVKLPHTQHHEAHESTGRPLSPPSPPGGCSCFSLPSKRGGKKRKQKKKQVKGGGLGSNNNDLGGKREQEKIEEEWASVLKELEGVGEGQWDRHAGIFDVKGTEMEFKRVSKKEKQLTEEAQKFLEKVASTSARLTSPPH